MSLARAYTICLDLSQDGVPVFCDLTLTPIGSCATIPGSFWTQLLNNIAKRPTTASVAELDSLLKALRLVLGG